MSWLWSWIGKIIERVVVVLLVSYMAVAFLAIPSLPILYFYFGPIWKKYGKQPNPAAATAIHRIERECADYVSEDYVSRRKYELSRTILEHAEACEEGRPAEHIHEPEDEEDPDCDEECRYEFLVDHGYDLPPRFLPPRPIPRRLNMIGLGLIVAVEIPWIGFLVGPSIKKRIVARWRSKKQVEGTKK